MMEVLTAAPVSMTLPAAPVPVWPSSSTTRVEATFSDRRISVVSSSTVGKAAKSSGLTMWAATIITITAIAMLKVNSRSSTNGGSGSTIIDSTISTAIGAPSAAMMPARGPRRDCSFWISGFMSRLSNTATETHRHREAHG